MNSCSMKEESEMAIPPLFICPISLELLKDPVTLSTGQTYERSSIQQWLSSGNLTCPVTMQHLHDPTIVPNHTLRHLISDWLLTGSAPQPDPQDLSPKAPPFAALKRSLEGRDTGFEAMARGLEALGTLSEDPGSASCLVMLGFLPLLLELALGRAGDGKLAAQALSCLVKLLPFSGFECLNVLEGEGNSGSGRFVSLFKSGNSSIRTDLCRMISMMSSCSTTKELCSMLTRDGELLREVAAFAASSKSGIEALSMLSRVELNREALVREGAVDGLISYLISTEKGVTSAITTLERLLALDTAKEAFLRNPSSISCLVRRVFEVSDHEGSESAVGALSLVCRGSYKAREEAIESGVLTQLLLLLQSQCIGRTKTKARMLLKLLRSKEE